MRPEQDYICVTYTYENFFVTAEAAWYAAQPQVGEAGYLSNRCVIVPVCCYMV